MLRLSAVFSVLPVLLATLALGVTAGCGGSDEAEEKAATPAEAVAEIGKIKTLLATPSPRRARETSKPPRRPSPTHTSTTSSRSRLRSASETRT